jgi:hypothetical protein
MAAVEYAGSLVFTLRTDPSAVDAATTVALRDAFARRLNHRLPAEATEPARAREIVVTGASA